MEIDTERKGNGLNEDWKILTVQELESPNVFGSKRGEEGKVTEGAGEGSFGVGRG